MHAGLITKIALSLRATRWGFLAFALIVFGPAQARAVDSINGRLCFRSVSRSWVVPADVMSILTYPHLLKRAVAADCTSYNAFIQACAPVQGPKCSVVYPKCICPADEKAAGAMCTSSSPLAPEFIQAAVKGFDDFCTALSASPVNANLIELYDEAERAVSNDVFFLCARREI
ncbi:hypothetical protein M427DRAFT_41883 [Gonapodya prolifera JEL478]|uniref:Uncharacterized protein n=1 Tax=Gonapodya prolifera (strain JEL478) TaxID=1344416 RepID=A0A139AST1_GONPJ|nr:hypothetical protein M427DRAFT_41883 [Gonapodya prolifera JEL478]|eukprot:KXS19555.1 hypothetical protein M427DRAFT_41883 [Gonapodya prolifera JEL478]